MKRFLVVYHAPLSAAQQMTDASPDQVKAGMEAWMTWAKKAGSAIVDLGTPLGVGRNLTGGTVSNSSDTVVGYSILQGDSMDFVTTLLKDHPHLRMPGFSIALFESISMPGT